MKKLFSFFATVALALGFTACEDVPAPYEVNDGGNTTIPGQENTIFSTEFDGGATDGFTFSNVSMNGLSYVWTCDASYGYLKASAYAGGACHAAESWAVSPAINLSDCTKATLTFRHAINQIGDTDLMPDMMTVWVCTDYAGNAATASWTQLTVPTYPSGTSWTFVGSDNIDLADFCGNDKVYIGFKYISTDQNAGSWEVDAFKIVGDGTPMEGNEPSTGDVLLSESFASSLGDFVNYTTSGEGAWVNDFKTACATGYDNGTKLTTAGTYYLVSPEISLEGQTEVHVSYEYILRYDRGQENQQLLISDNFDSSKPAEGWTLLNGTHKEGVDYVNFETADVDIPASYMGKKVRIALRFNSDAVSSATWEVKNFTVQKGKASGNTGGETPDNPDTPTPSGDNLLTNGGFETWNSSSEPSGWKSASTASNATLSQSTDAHSGSYSVCVGGATSANKRLGSAEMTLKPGTYAVRFYAKAVTAEGGTVCPGYVPVTDGKVGSYKYGSYVNDLTPSEWTEVNHTFTLDEQTTLCLVVMNSKTPGEDVLIDDFSLTTANGGLVGSGEEPSPAPEGSGYALASSIQSGASYLIGTLEGSTYKVATASAASYTYGYLYVKDATSSNGVITSATESEEFVFNAVEGGYTIQDAEGRYLYLTGTFNSFNYSTDPSVEGAVWAVTFNADGTASIKNVLKEKTIQYSSQYTSYGAYSSVTNTLPSLFVKK